MNESSTAAPSSSKRVKKNPLPESNEQSKLQLVSEKSLYEVQCFAEELFATRKMCQKGPALNAFVDPIVNLNIDLLLNKIQSSTNELENKGKLCLPGTQDTIIQKLSVENAALRRKEAAAKIDEKLSLRKDVIIDELRKEASKSRVWISDLQEQNDRLSSQLFMFQMQQNAIMHQQQNYRAVAVDNDYSREDDVKINNFDISND